MDPLRIESYLRSTCSVLDFDIGELWSVTKLPDQDPSFRLIQVYKSPTYEDFHSLLMEPNVEAKANKKHRFSPIICRGVCDGGQIVWANTRVSEGLNGRTDLPLNTAVGVPICSIGSDLYILVLFAVGIINMTSHAVEYLTTVARAVTESTTSFLSAAVSPKADVTPAKTEAFVGLWNINELIQKYSNEVEFHLLPIGKLQRYFDCNEILLFCDFFMDFKLSRDGRFTVKQLQSLRDTYRSFSKEHNSESVSSEESKGWDIDNAVQEDTENVNKPPLRPSFSGVFLHDEGMTTASATVKVEDELKQPPIESTVQSADVPASSTPSNEPGVYCIDLNSIVCEVDGEKKVADELSAGLLKSASSSSIVKLSNDCDINKSILHIYAHMTYKLSQCRFHEFLIAILGMTVFEAAEMWLVSEKTSELLLVAAVYRTPAMKQWITLSESLRLKIGAEGPGNIVLTGRSYWDPDFARIDDPTADLNDPRLQAARNCGVRTALGIPLPGMRGVCGSLMFYSTRSHFPAEPLLILFLERAISLLASTSLEATSWTRLEHKLVDAIHKDANIPVTLATADMMSAQPMQRWLAEGEQGDMSLSHSAQVTANILQSVVPTTSFMTPPPSSQLTASSAVAGRSTQQYVHSVTGEPVDFHIFPRTVASNSQPTVVVDPLCVDSNLSLSTKLRQPLTLPPTLRYAESDINLKEISDRSERDSLEPSQATQLIVNKKLGNFDERLEYWRSLVSQHYNALNSNSASEKLSAGKANDAKNNKSGSDPFLASMSAASNKTSSRANLNASVTVKSEDVNTMNRESSFSAVKREPIDPQILSTINPYLHHRTALSRGNSSSVLNSAASVAAMNGAPLQPVRSSPHLSVLQSNSIANNRSDVDLRRLSSVVNSSAGHYNALVGGTQQVHSPNNTAKFADGVAVSETLGEEWNDPVVNAAYTLANFGNINVQWGAFLAGSDNEVGFKMKLGSNEIVAEANDGQHSGMKRSVDSTSGLHKCKVDDCDNFVENNQVQYCLQHRGTRRCQKEGCNKCAQSATKYCIAHGGGRRCTYPGCFKGARDKFFCAAHGGGKRCTFEGCNKSAVGGSNLCTAHGGGKRCQYPGCSKSSQSSTNFCVRHGGGRTCAFAGCSKVARGKTEFCAAHGGGIRCRYHNCNKLAVGAQQLCRTHQSLSKEEIDKLPPLTAQLEEVMDEALDMDDPDDM